MMGESRREGSEEGTGCAIERPWRDGVDLDGGGAAQRPHGRAHNHHSGDAPAGAPEPGDGHSADVGGVAAGGIDDGDA